MTKSAGALTTNVRTGANVAASFHGTMRQPGCCRAQGVFGAQGQDLPQQSRCFKVGE